MGDDKILPLRKIERLYVEDIIVSEGHRQVVPEKVAGIAFSMQLIGQQNPISVWSPDNVSVHLIAGRHRLEAAKSLSWDHIAGIVVEMDERQRRMWEISENLHRSELTASERSKFEAEWVALAGQDKVAQVGPPVAGGQQPLERGIRAAMRELGVSRAELGRAVKIAGLTPEAKAVAVALKLDDNQSALLEAAKANDPIEQVAALRERAQRKTHPRSPAPPEDQAEAVNAIPQAFKALSDAIEGVEPKAAAHAYKGALMRYADLDKLTDWMISFTDAIQAIEAGEEAAE